MLRKKLLNGFVAVLVSSLCVSCAFVNTTLREDEVARQKLNKADTHCDSLFRVYSSLAYYGCLLHSEPQGNQHIYLASEYSLHALDVILSGALDTVALPYTIYQQSKYGSIKLERDI